jgi:hypothetical protein
MIRRISLWMFAGIIVACCWFAASLLLGPTYPLRHFTILEITAPASLLGSRMPLGVGWFVLLNGAAYASLGFAGELLARLRHRR